jgi:hypothetical protein
LKGRGQDKEAGEAKEAELFQQIGKLQMELEWLKKNRSCSDARELRRLVDVKHPELSISRQCEILGLPRSTLYYRPVPVREASLRIMARLDALYLEDPCSGSRRMVHDLANEGIRIGRDRVRNLMRRMGLRAIDQKPRTTVPGQPSERFPCLVDLKPITAVDQVWATDITYIPLQKGFLYLVAIMDSTPGTGSAGSSPTALTRSSVWRPWRWPSVLTESHRSSTPTRAASTPPQNSWLGSKQRRSRSVGQEESGVTTTSWWKDCGGLSSM